jgi:hypothetical protein
LVNASACIQFGTCTRATIIQQLATTNRPVANVKCCGSSVIIIRECRICTELVPSTTAKLGIGSEHAPIPTAPLRGVRPETRISSDTFAARQHAGTIAHAASPHRRPCENRSATSRTQSLDATCVLLSTIVSSRERDHSLGRSRLEAAPNRMNASAGSPSMPFNHDR